MTTSRLVLLGAIAALGSLAIQVIVPALPIVVRGIGASPDDGQLIISVYLIVLALGQLVWAPVTDKVGRRPVVLVGLLIFLCGTLVCALAGELWTMLAGRAVQAIGASSSLVTARAMATDRAKAGEAAAPLAVLTSVTLISPAVAPLIGGVVASMAGWRTLFWLMGGLSVLATLLAIRMLPETRAGDQLPIGARDLANRYLDVVRGAGFLPLAVANALISSAFYLFLAVSPFVLAAAGATTPLAGLFYSIVASAIIIGTLVVPLIVRRDPVWLAPAGSLALTAGGIGVLLTALSGGGVIPLVGSMTIIAFGSGLSGPGLLADAIDRQRGRAASVASLFGTLQMGVAALISTVIVRLFPSTSVEIALIGILMIAAVVVRRMAR